MRTRHIGAVTAALALTAVAAPGASALDRIERPDRIVGGTESTESPAAAALYADNGAGQEVFACTATVLSATKVLTAPHCVDGIDETHVRIGSLKHASGGTTHQVASATEHQSADLAVITLATPATGAKTTKLASADPATGDTNTLYGWGRTSQSGDASPTLKQTDVPVESTSATDAYNGTAIQTGVGDGHAWKGDSGGPQLNAAGEQVGVCSVGQFGIYQNYTSVARYADWIKSTAGLA